MVDWPLTLREAATKIRSKKLSSVDLTTQALQRADKYDKQLGTYIKRFDKEALQAAKEADEKTKRGDKLGILNGVPIAIKDIIATREGPTTANSLVTDPEWGKGRDATVVSRLRDAGAIIIGKVTTSEFAYGRPDPKKPFPIPRNPWGLNRWSGGSSAGSGNGVAAGLFCAALGTDTGGSVRGPAASCGVSGFIATYGRVPKTGVIPLGYSLDRVGTIARSAEDCAMVTSVLSGYAPNDPSAVDRPALDMLGTLDERLKGVRIGVARVHRDYNDTDPAVDKCFEQAVSLYGKLGASIKEVALPYYNETSIAANLTMISEALAYHGEDLRNRWHDYCSTTRGKVAQATFVSGADYVQAQRIRSLAKRRLLDVFDNVDVIIMPTQGFGALEYNELGFVNDPTNKMGRLYFTVYWSGVGNPVMTIPMGFTENMLPLGFQICGRLFDEPLVARVGHAYQKETDWHLKVGPAIN